MKQTVRYRMIDCLKGIACLAVVLIHYNFADNLGLAVKAMMRFAVPFFFFVSGFFMPDGENMIYRKRTWKKLKHIFSLIVFSSVFYAVYTIVWNKLVFADWSISEYVAEKISFVRCVKLVLSCDPFVYAHLWFLLALVFCYVVFLLFDNYKVSNILWFIAIPLLAMFFVVAEFSQFFGVRSMMPLLGTDVNLMFFNMPILRAMPFFMIGMLVKKNEAVIVDKVSKIPWGFYLIVIISGSALSIYERLCIKDSQYYIGNMMTFACMVCIALAYRDKGNSVLEYIGNKLSLYVYIFHIAVGKALDIVGSKLHITQEPWYLPGRTLGVLVGSLAVAWIAVTISTYRKNPKRV